jgi:hypothetical protein
MEVGIKVLVDVAEDCEDPFQYAAEQGNEKARERIFDLEGHHADMFDAENLIATLVDPPNEHPQGDDLWDYDRSRWTDVEAKDEQQPKSAIGNLEQGILPQN